MRSFEVLCAKQQGEAGRTPTEFLRKTRKHFASPVSKIVSEFEECLWGEKEYTH